MVFVNEHSTLKEKKHMQIDRSDTGGQLALLLRLNYCCSKCFPWEGSWRKCVWSTARLCWCSWLHLRSYLRCQDNKSAGKLRLGAFSALRWHREYHLRTCAFCFLQHVCARGSLYAMWHRSSYRRIQKAAYSADIFFADLSVHLCLLWFLGGTWRSWGPVLKLKDLLAYTDVCPVSASYWKYLKSSGRKRLC